MDIYYEGSITNKNKFEDLHLDAPDNLFYIFDLSEKVDYYV